MNDRGLFTVTAQGFEPYDARARALHQRLLNKPYKKPVFLGVRTARNPEFSAMAHVVFGKLAAGLGVPMDAIKSYLKEQTGRFDLVKLPNGTVIKLRKSVAFEAMTQEQFSDFWADCLPVIFEKLLGGVKSKDYDDIVAILSGKGEHRG